MGIVEFRVPLIQGHAGEHFCHQVEVTHLAPGYAITSFGWDPAFEVPDDWRIDPRLGTITGTYPSGSRHYGVLITVTPRKTRPDPADAAKAAGVSAPSDTARQALLSWQTQREMFISSTTQEDADMHFAAMLRHVRADVTGYDVYGIPPRLSPASIQDQRQTATWQLGVMLLAAWLTAGIVILGITIVLDNLGVI